MNCPTSAALEQFLGGSSPQPAAIEAHLADCSHCREVLDGLSDRPGLRRWVSRALELPTELSADPVLCRVVTELQSASGEFAKNEGPRRKESHWAAGRMMGQYRIDGEIGRGGMGVVLRATDIALGRVVALKVLRWQDIEPRARARLVHEAQAVARLRHDNVITIHAVVNPSDDAPYLVMEYLEGGTLAALIASKGRLEPELAAALVVQVADGLETAHSAGLIHRDVKPANVLVEARSGRAKITDFGLARWAERASGFTQDNALAGTPVYMSPEQARGASDLDRRSDIYSLGVTLYEALTGTVPFHGAPHMVFQQVISEEPRPVRLLNDRIPRDLETICLKAMAKEPARRYQSAGELALDLRRYQRGEPIAARPVGRIERGWRFCQRRPLVSALVIALLLAMTGGISGISWKWAEAVLERQRTERERDRAVRNFRQAREAVDTYLTTVSDNAELKAQNLEPLRRDLLRTARDFYERFAQQEPDDPELQAELGRAHARLGQITAVLESAPKALEHYQKMGAIFERLCQAYPGKAIYQKELAEATLKQGESLRAGAGSGAEATLKRGGEIYEHLARAHPGEPTYRHGQARSLRSLANFYLFVPGDRMRAQKALLAARKIYEGLPGSYSEKPAVQFERALVVSNLAKLYARSDRPHEHRDTAIEAISILEPLAKAHAENPEYLFYLADSLSELGESYRRLGQPEPARTSLEKALEASENVERAHPANGYNQHLVADIAYSLASLHYHELRDRAGARNLFLKALKIEQELAGNYPNVGEYMFYFNNLVRDLRDWFGDTAQLDAVREELTAAITDQEARSAPEKRDETRLQHLYAHRGEIHRLLGQYSEAFADLKKAGAASLDAGDSAVVHGQHGDYDLAQRAAASLAKNDSGNGTELYRAAQCSARLAALARDDHSLAAAKRQELAEMFSRQAVEWLRRAHSFQYFSTPSTRYLLLDDRDLESVRGRGDFRALVGQVNTAPAAGK